MSEQKQVRVYADGVYDLFHYGHARQLEQCKKVVPNAYLIVGVCSQEDVLKYKGQTVMDGEQRVQGVQHCKWVDEVIYPAPWIIDEKFLTDNKIDYVAHDDEPYVTAGVDDAYALCKRLGKFKATQRTQGVSTSDLINKILQDRDSYVLRNLSRGYTRQQLGLSLPEYIYFKGKILLNKVLCKKKQKKE